MLGRRQGAIGRTNDGSIRVVVVASMFALSAIDKVREIYVWIHWDCPAIQAKISVSLDRDEATHTR